MAFPWPAALDSTAVAHAQGPNTPAAMVTAMSEFGALRFEVSGGKSYKVIPFLSLPVQAKSPIFVSR
jgi:hypothetical protein